MDELLRDFLTETSESLDRVDAELVRFEQEPNNGQILGNIFRLVHTIKGTCGFLALPRLETLAHAAETLMGKFRDGMPVTADAVTLILSRIDRIKSILDEHRSQEHEPEGDDGDLIDQLGRMARREQPRSAPQPRGTAPNRRQRRPEPSAASRPRKPGKPRRSAPRSPRNPTTERSRASSPIIRSASTSIRSII